MSPMVDFNPLVPALRRDFFAEALLYGTKPFERVGIEPVSLEPGPVFRSFSRIPNRLTAA